MSGLSKDITGCHYLNVWKKKFTPAEISNVVGHYPTSITCGGQLQNVVVTFVRKVWPPKVEDGHPFGHGAEGLEQRCHVVWSNWAPF
jgi:hypothetical protein